jgi:hypothetical protein
MVMKNAAGAMAGGNQAILTLINVYPSRMRIYTPKLAALDLDANRKTRTIFTPSPRH